MFFCNSKQSTQAVRVSNYSIVDTACLPNKLLESSNFFNVWFTVNMSPIASPPSSAVEQQQQ